MGLTRYIKKVSKNLFTKTKKTPVENIEPIQIEQQLSYVSNSTLLSEFTQFLPELPNLVEDIEIEGNSSFCWSREFPSKYFSQWKDFDLLEISPTVYQNIKGADTLVESVGNLPSLFLGSDKLVASPNTIDTFEYPPSLYIEPNSRKSHFSDWANLTYPSTSSARSSLSHLTTRLQSSSSDSQYSIIKKNSTTKHDMLSTETLVSRSPVYYNKLSWYLKNQSLLPTSEEKQEDNQKSTSSTKTNDLLNTQQILKFFTPNDTPLPQMIKSDKHMIIPQHIIVQPPLNPPFEKVEIIDYSQDQETQVIKS